MAIIIPGWQVLVMSGEVFSGLTVGLSGAYLADIVVESGGMVIDTVVSTSLITFTSASQPGGHLGHGNSIASPVTS